MSYVKSNIRAAVAGRLTRSLPARRGQASHWLSKLLMLRKPFVGRFLGGRLEVHPGELASTSAFFRGSYEREVTIWCRELLRIAPPALVVDIGANFGYYPLLFGLMSRGRVKTIAFEPDPTTFEWLSRNIALNPGLPVTAIRSAVGDVNGQTVAFETAKPDRNLWSRVRSDVSNEHAAGIVQVPTTTLDTYCREQSIASIPLTLIDVEGYETKVVAGMARGIANRTYGAVMIEYHPTMFADPIRELEQLAGRFQNHGYTARRFQHFEDPNSDKNPAYYRLEWSDSLLKPISYDSLSSWEHFLFLAPEFPWQPAK